jgi:hypothetical protein
VQVVRLGAWFNGEVDDQVLAWLSEGDPAIVWQVERDLLRVPEAVYARTRRKVTESGWGARLMSARSADGSWGGGAYTPKWTSTFYTLQLLALLGVDQEETDAVASCRMLLDCGVQKSGGVRLWKSESVDTCVTGMMVTTAIRFGQRHDPRVGRMLDWLLGEQMEDGGWNCRSHRAGTKHGSFHTTTSVLEALEAARGTGRKVDAGLLRAAEAGREFLARHQLYRSHRTGVVARSEFTRFTFPHWWKFDVLRGLDHFRCADAPWDARLEDPLALVVKKRGTDGRWTLPSPHPGRTWFAMEKTGQPSRWNTLRALRVLRWAERARTSRAQPIEARGRACDF